MTVRYRTAGAWGAGEGSNLSAAQVDENFYTLAQLIDDFVVPAGVGIASISVAGTQVTFHLTDSSVQGPFDLPLAAFHWVDEDWTAGTTYDELDVFRVPTGEHAGIYLVLQEYEAPTEFDPSPEPNTEGDFLVKMFGIPQVVLEVIEDFSGDLTVVAAHNGAYIKMMESTENFVRLPADLGTEDDLPLGMVVTVNWADDGYVQFVPESETAGPTILTPETTYLRKKYSTATAIHTGDNEWTLGGDLLIDEVTEVVTATETETAT